MYSTYPTERWGDALISGNGQMDIMIYGDPDKKHIKKGIPNHISFEKNELKSFKIELDK